jgi:N utilization substance protein B
LADGVWAEREALDAAIGAASTGWRVERMAPVDRSVLRLALWELWRRPELPAAVVISEAVRLAKAYSTERSGAFVNGVLGRLEQDKVGED